MKHYTDIFTNFKVRREFIITWSPSTNFKGETIKNYFSLLYPGCGSKITYKYKYYYKISKLILFMLSQNIHIINHLFIIPSKTKSSIPSMSIFFQSHHQKILTHTLNRNLATSTSMNENPFMEGLSLWAV